MKRLHNLTLKNLYEIRYRLLAVAALAIFLGWLVGGNPLITGLVAMSGV